jgi:hypothetical protein
MGVGRYDALVAKRASGLIGKPWKVRRPMVLVALDVHDPDAEVWVHKVANVTRGSELLPS